MINGAKFLIDNGFVDSAKVCIAGSSAGGLTVLSTLFHPKNPFAAAVSIYGVADLEDLCKVTILNCLNFKTKIIIFNIL